MDIREAIKPKSDQLNADDLIAGPITVTIKDVKQGSAEQPVNVVTEETPGRPYRPSKSMLRVLAEAWDTDTRSWAGKRITLYRNPKIKFGGMEVGGIEISHVSGIDGEMKIPLTATRGKKRLHTVKPLAVQSPYAPSQDWLALIQAATTVDEKRAIWGQATEDGADQAYMARLKEAGSS
jgi:hypothetical protein